MRKQKITILGCIALFFLTSFSGLAYPIDGYYLTGIKRLVRLQLILEGKIKETKPLYGARKSIDEIALHMKDYPVDSTVNLPPVDPWLQKQIQGLFPNLHESYAIALLDISPGRPMRYAQRQETRGFQPGSVGKLAVVTGLFCELENVYPNDFSKRRELLKTRRVKAGPWGVYDSHTVPFYDVETG